MVLLTHFLFSWLKVKLLRQEIGMENVKFKKKKYVDFAGRMNLWILVENNF